MNEAETSSERLGHDLHINSRRQNFMAIFTISIESLKRDQVIRDDF